jgi:hypothetical protein
MRLLPQYPGRSTKGVSFGVSGLCRLGLLGIGAFGDIGPMGKAGVFSGGGMAGLALRTDGGFRAEMLGAAGARRYVSWGQGDEQDFDVVTTWGHDPGASATLPFAGFRGGFGYIFGRTTRGHFNIGAVFSVDWDLSRARKSYTWTEQEAILIFTYETHTYANTQTIGGTNYLFGLTAGATIDFGG